LLVKIIKHLKYINIRGIQITFSDLLEALKQTKDFFLKMVQNDTNQKESSDNNSTSTEIINAANEGYKNLLESRYLNQIFKKSVHIYSHLDTDGISSAAILAKAFDRAKIGFQISILNQLETQHIEMIKLEIEKYNRFIIFTDFGSGQIHILEKMFPPESFLILDHHSPHESVKEPRINHINPYFYGVDGSFQISGAGITYLFAKTLDPNNIDLAYIAIIGAVGDAQNQSNEKGEFQSPNRDILDDAIKSGKIEVITDVAISRSRPIYQALAYTLPEILPGISNDENTAKRFLESKGIKYITDLNEPRTIVDLSIMEKRTLSKALLEYALVNANLGPSFAQKLVTTFYLLKDFDPKTQINDAREISSLLNACGRSGHPSLGIGILLKEPNAFEEAIKETKNHKKNIAVAMQWADEHMVQHANIVSIYGGDSIDEKIIGTIASMLTHSGKKIEKPIIAYAESDKESFKISARAPSTLIDKGLDLGAVMRRVTTELNIDNPAGGHPPAAGAKIPRSRLKEFLDATDKAVKEMLEKK
jgi:RecJ-like exonuclease